MKSDRTHTEMIYRIDGTKVRAARKSAGLSREHVGAHFTGTGFVARMEQQPKGTDLTLNEAKVLADVLGVHIDDLLSPYKPVNPAEEFVQRRE